MDVVGALPMSLTVPRPTDPITGCCLCPGALSGPQDQLGLDGGSGQRYGSTHFPGSSPQTMIDRSWRVSTPAAVPGWDNSEVCPVQSPGVVVVVVVVGSQQD